MVILSKKHITLLPWTESSIELNWQFNNLKACDHKYYSDWITKF
jgi:hypothetical protein